MSNRNNTDLYFQHEVARGPNSSVKHVTSPLHSLSAVGSGVQVNTQSLLQAATASAQNVGRMLDDLDFQTKHVGQGREVNKSRFQLDPASGRMRELPCCEETVWVEDPASELRANIPTRPTTIERCEMNKLYARSPHVVKQVNNVHPMQRPKTCTNFSAEVDSFDAKDELGQREYLRQLDEWKTNRRVLESDLLAWSEAAIARGKQDEEQQRIVDARALQIATRKKRRKDRKANKGVDVPYFGNEADIVIDENDSSGSEPDDESEQEESKSQELLDYLRAVAAERSRIASVGETIADLIPLLRKRHVSLDDLQLQLQELSTRLIGTASGDRNIIAYTERLEARMREQDKMRESQQTEQSAMMTVTVQRDRFKALVGIKDEQIEQLKAAVDSLRLQSSSHTQNVSGSMRGVGLGGGLRASRFGGGDTPMGPWNGLSQWTFPHDPADRSNSPKIEAFTLGSNSMNMGAYQGNVGGAKGENNRNYSIIGAASPNNASAVAAATPLSRIGSSLLLGGGAIRKHASFKNKPAAQPGATPPPTPPTPSTSINPPSIVAMDSVSPQQSHPTVSSGNKPNSCSVHRAGADPPSVRRVTMPSAPENDSDVESCDETQPPNMGRRGTTAGSQTNNTSRTSSVNHEYPTPIRTITSAESTEIADLKSQITTLRAVVRLTCMTNQKLQERLKLAATKAHSAHRNVQFEFAAPTNPDTVKATPPNNPGVDFFAPVSPPPTVCTACKSAPVTSNSTLSAEIEPTPTKLPITRCRGTQTEESRIELEKILIAMSQRKGTFDARAPVTIASPVPFHDEGGPRFQAGATIWPQNRRGVTNEERAIWSAASLYEAVMNTTSDWVANQTTHIHQHQEETMKDVTDDSTPAVSPKSPKRSGSQLARALSPFQHQGTTGLYVGIPQEKVPPQKLRHRTTKFRRSFGDTPTLDFDVAPPMFSRPQRPKDPNRNLEAEATSQTQAHRPSKLLEKHPRSPPTSVVPRKTVSKETCAQIGSKGNNLTEHPLGNTKLPHDNHRHTKAEISNTCSRSQPFVADPPPF